MKIFLLAIALIAFGANAQIKAPTIYGKLNKMIRYIDQDAKNYKSFNGVEDAGAPSRLGVKGSLNTSQTKVNYVMEMGFDSEDTDTAGGIYLRRAAFNLDWGFGTITIGQEWTVTALVGIKLDPLNETGASLWGVDTFGAADPLTNDVSGGTTNLGFISQGRKEQIAYKTPEINGFQLALGNHRGDQESRLSSETADDTFEALLTYKLDMGSMKADLYAGYVTTDGDSANKDDSIFGGVKIGMGDFAITGMYTTQAFETAAGVDEDKTYLMGTAAYKMGDGTIAFTYGNRTDDTATETKRNQMTLGYLYDINKYVQLNAFGSLYKYEMGATKNDATILGLGARLNF